MVCPGPRVRRGNLGCALDEELAEGTQGKIGTRDAAGSQQAPDLLQVALHDVHKFGAH